VSAAYARRATSSGGVLASSATGDSTASAELGGNALTSSRSGIPLSPGNSRPAVLTLIVINVLWVALSLIALTTGELHATLLGEVWDVLQALVVAGFAALQVFTLGRTPAGSRPAPRRRYVVAGDEASPATVGVMSGSNVDSDSTASGHDALCGKNAPPRAGQGGNRVRPARR
jgi:hypothetical protein